MSAHFRPIILNAFPESTWDPIVLCASQGIALADRLLRQERWLDWAVGRDQRGDLRRVGVMWMFRESCLAQSLPFACLDCDNTAGNCHHIEIRSQNVRLHVTKTDALRSMPRETRLRNDERLSNQLDLFKPAILTTNLDEINTWYGWLTFNAGLDGQLTHLAIGLPEDRQNEWLDLVPIPLHERDAFSHDGDEPPPPGPEQLMKFKDDVRKRLEPPSEDGEAQEGGTDDR